MSGGDGSHNIGGLAGYNDHIISASSASGPVTGGSGSFNIGGLVGPNNGGTITASFATGSVSGDGGAGGSQNVGGLAGSDSGSSAPATPPAA